MGGYIEQPRFSCALAGQQTVLAIPRALPVVHAGPGCSGKVFAFSATNAGFQGEGYGGGGAVSSTNTGETDVVFGGEPKLERFVGNALRVLDGDLFVILSGCTSGLIGDDVVRVAQQYARDGHPVIGAETPGFRGNSYVGHEIVVHEIIDQFVGDVTPAVRPGLVNVFASVPPQNPFWRGDLAEIKRVLEGIGLQVNILFGAGSAGISEWRDLPNAQFNLVLSPWVGLDAAELAEKKYGTPYLHLPFLPIGPELTGKTLRTIADFAGLPAGPVEEFIAHEELVFYDYFVSTADFVADYRNMIPSELYVVGDSAYALGATAFLVNELGFVPEGIYLTDDPPENRQSDIRQALSDIVADLGDGDPVPRFEIDGRAIQDSIRTRLHGSTKALILGSTWEDYLARETGNLSLHLSLPITNDVVIDRSYAGYRGGLRLMEDVYTSIFKAGDIADTTLTRNKQ
ncbi:nitrogenase component 1 [Brooklawnia cerclae]|uniref:Nitrogenase molybdenum-iron protein beta chain n=1 Tax=Brooklawnia cerclae TaxID=349934 RepID=A0ABX0SFA3_9ACTN|nr:nitrogenase component 1 [Brooklawnia cerclae]NIH57064.1 nitrogenase molybdenum-iron protein beta chain [Brooklawnia cerclae]